MEIDNSRDFRGGKVVDKFGIFIYVVFWGKKKKISVLLGKKVKFCIFNN